MVIDTTENEITSRASKAGTLLCARKQQHKKKKRTSFRSNFGKGKTTAAAIVWLNNRNISLIDVAVD